MAPPSPPSPPSMSPPALPRHHVPLVLVALVLGGLSVVVPLVGLPAIVVCFLVFIVVGGRRRLVVAALATPLALAGFVRFVLASAVPNIITAGQVYSEEKAVSRLREVLWAEKLAQESKRSDRNGDGVGEFVPLDGLVLPSNELLKTGLYKPVPEQPGIYRVEGFFFRVDVPADPQQAQRRWLGYAWPAGEAKGGTRAFVITENEEICESTHTAYAGLQHMPQTFAALQEARWDAPACGKGTDGGEWKPWRKKKPKTEK